MERIINRIPCLERRYHRNRRTSTSPNATADTEPVVCSHNLDDDHLFVKRMKACDTSAVEVTSSEVNLAYGANSLANIYRSVTFHPTVGIYPSGHAHPETKTRTHDEVQFDKNVDQDVIKDQDVACYQDVYELPTRKFSDKQIEDIIHRAADKCSQQVVETINRQFTIFSNRMDVNDQEVSRISSRVSIMEENCESHSDMQSVSESKVHKRKPTLLDSELCCEVSMTRSNVELVSEGKKNDSSTRPRSATGAISRRKKSHCKRHNSLIQTELKVLRSGKLC